MSQWMLPLGVMQGSSNSGTSSILPSELESATRAWGRARPYVVIVLVTAL